MQIRVKCGCGEGSCPEWAIVELQGAVESQMSIGNRLQNLEIGRLCRSSSSQGSHTFTVGYHQLTGTRVPLKKPLLVLKKNKKKNEGTERDEVDCDGSASAELEVMGIIRHRILFKTRPKALISKPQIKDRKIM